MEAVEVMPNIGDPNVELIVEEQHVKAISYNIDRCDVPGCETALQLTI